jgi:hypothetical protein
MKLRMRRLLTWRLLTSFVLTALLSTATAVQPVHGQATPTPAPLADGWKSAHLSQARRGIATATVGQRVLFAGGRSVDGAASRYVDTVDIYDADADTWSTAALSTARRVASAIVVGNLAIFAGGDHGPTTVDRTVDIYNADTDGWSAAQLSSDAPLAKAVVAGTRVLFIASGTQVDVFDTATGQWSAKSLATSRSTPAVAVAGQQAMIVGTTGEVLAGAARSSVLPDQRTPVDIYDATIDSWQAAELSDTRWSAVALAVSGSRIYVAGGSNTERSMPATIYSDAVDVYDTETGAWSALRLSQARDSVQSIAVGQQILFAGGVKGVIGGVNDADWIPRVDIYDTVTGAWSTAELTAGRRFSPFAVGDQAVFAGGFLGARALSRAAYAADIYDSRSDTWAHKAELHQSYGTSPLGIALGPLGLAINFDSIDVYDSRTGGWSLLMLPAGKREGEVATIGSRLLVPDATGTVFSYDFAALLP